MAHPIPTTQRLDVEAWGALDDDVDGELVDGLLEEEEVPSYVHEAVVSWLLGLLRDWLIPRGGFVFGSDAKIAISRTRGRKADVIAWLPGSRPPARRSSVAKHPPDLVVEVVTATPRDQRRDRVEKRAEYAAIGVRHYWIVDPETRVVEMLDRGADGRFVEALVASDGRHHVVAGTEGLDVDLDALWAEVDRLPDDDA
jgi:Uma2 family endonuclease